MEGDARLATRRRPRTRLRRRRDRHGRGRRGDRGGADRRRARRGHGGGGAAAQLERLPHARGGGLSAALPGVRGAQDPRQGRHHPAGSLRGWIHHGQLDVELPHAGGDAGVLGRALRPCRPRARGDGAVVRAHGGGAGGFALARAAQREQRAPAARRREDRHRGRRDPPQRARLLEPRVLRHGLPDQRQAVDAGDHHPGGAVARGAAARGSARRAPAGARGPRGGGAGARDGCARRASLRRARHAARASRGAGRRRHRLARDPAAQRRARSSPAPGRAHLPASDADLRRAHAPSRGRPLRRTAESLLRSLPAARRGRWPARLQARGAAAASAAVRHDPAGLRRAARGADALLHPGARAARAAARRLPSRQPRRPRRAARRRLAGARLSAHARRLGRRAPRAARDGRDPVRGGRNARLPRSRGVDRLCLLARGAGGHRRAADGASVHDGSVFPTSIGANPQLSIYALVARNAALLAEDLRRRA